MKLSQIMNDTDFEIIQGDDRDIAKLTIDSRQAGEDSFFICIQGLHVDGHDYIEQAMENGAVAVLCDRRLDHYPEALSVVLVADSRAILNTVAANFYEHPDQGMRLIGVTGTNGKTSVTYFLETILREDGRSCGVIGTTGVAVNGEKLPIAYATSTTPDTIELYGALAEMKKCGVTDVVMEVTSHALALQKVDNLRFEVGIFTNLTQDHLDFHETFDQYLAAKAKLFGLCKWSILNEDDGAVEALKQAATGQTITYSIDKPSDYQAREIAYAKNGSMFSVVAYGDKYRFGLHIPGKFSVYNAMGAIVTALQLGLSVRTVVNGVAKIKGVPGRIQPVPNDKGFGVFVDYAHSPDGLDNILRAVKFFTTGRVITVFGCGGDRDRTKRPIMGRIAGELSDYCIITSDNPRSERPEDILAEVEPGAKETGCEYSLEPDRRKAIFAAVAMAQEGDSVVIAGKGHEDYQEFENKRRIHFDDVQVAWEALEDLA